MKREFEVICKTCGKSFKVLEDETNFPIKGDKYYCCRSCANTRHHSLETKSKIGNSLSKTNFNTNKEYLKYISELINEGIILNIDNYSFIDKQINTKNIKLHECEICGRKFYKRIIKSGNIGGGTTCCEDCHTKLFSLRAKELRKKEIENGTFQGWKSRNIISYAEKFWINVLDNNNIPYKREYILPYGDLHKGERYFLDFYIEIGDRKIDLEIDGKQHNERKDFDIKRDKFVRSQNIEVYRISWNQINSEEGKLLMKEKIDNFLNYIKHGGSLAMIIKYQ